MHLTKNSPNEKSSYYDALRELAAIREERERRFRQAATDTVLSTSIDFRFYRFKPELYIPKFLGWTPWAGINGHPGQIEILQHYTLCLRQQFERRAFQNGVLSLEAVRYWNPLEQIQNIIRVESAHTQGKSKLCAGMVSHFFDCFLPSIIYTYAPTTRQYKELLWKEIKVDRQGNDLLPGRVLETCEIKGSSADHFVAGRATDNPGGKGSERVHGQHNEFMGFVLDEAEGIAGYVFSALDAMMSSGISFAIMPANPRTRSSVFYKLREDPRVKTFHLNGLNHPNVVSGREIVPQNISRDFVISMTAKHCTAELAHDEDKDTFELPFSVSLGEKQYKPGTIFAPDAEFMWRVLGKPPSGTANDTFVPHGRYDAAKSRVIDHDYEADVRFGVDCARWGDDVGTIWARQGMTIWRVARVAQQNTTTYVGLIQEEALRLAALRSPGTQNSFHVRVDAGGGFGGGIVDQLEDNLAIKTAYPHGFEVFEVNFGGTVYDDESYSMLVTEMYANTAETLKAARLFDPPAELEADLCDRKFIWKTVKGVAVKELEPKEKFRKRMQEQGKPRSPDDGDGCVLAVSPDFLFNRFEWRF